MKLLKIYLGYKKERLGLGNVSEIGRITEKEHRGQFGVSR